MYLDIFTLLFRRTVCPPQYILYGCVETEYAILVMDGLDDIECSVISLCFMLASRVGPFGFARLPPLCLQMWLALSIQGVVAPKD